MKFSINLYGVLDNIMNNNPKINYMGKFQPDELPNVLDCDLGLIWDGNLDDSDKNIGFKNYRNIIIHINYLVILLLMYLLLFGQNQQWNILLKNIILVMLLMKFMI